MQLTLRIGDETNPDELIYEGSLVDEMESTFLAYVASVGGRYESKARRWWFEDGRGWVEDGLEPLYVLFNVTQMHTWKVYQTPVGS